MFSPSHLVSERPIQELIIVLSVTGMTLMAVGTAVDDGPLYVCEPHVS